MKTPEEWLENFGHTDLEIIERMNLKDEYKTIQADALRHAAEMVDRERGVTRCHLSLMIEQEATKLEEQ